MATKKDDDNTQADDQATRLKNPDEWKTGDEPATRAQRSYLETLASEADEDVDDQDLTKADASKKIDELRKKTGRDDEGS